ncbi:MAG: hypothetical protein ABIP81_07320, partial [Terriglobales bacterium]
MADAVLALTSGDAAFQTRFDYLFQECRCSEASARPLPRVGLRIEPAGKGRLVAVFSSPDPANFGRSAAAALAEADTISDASPFVLEGDRISFRNDRQWQGTIASVAVNEVLRIQKHMLFFHAATVAVGGRGVMLVGDKGMGKTTLSLALAARGGDFLGDEYAAVDTRTLHLVPFRR